MLVRLRVRPGLRALGSRVLVRGWLAITLGHTIVSWRPLEPPELAHELEHVRQWERLGPIAYPLHYLGASLRAWAGGGDWYRDNAFEIAAREAARAAARPTAGPLADGAGARARTGARERAAPPGSGPEATTPDAR